MNTRRKTYLVSLMLATMLGTSALKLQAQEAGGEFCNPKTHPELEMYDAVLMSVVVRRGSGAAPVAGPAAVWAEDGILEIRWYSRARRTVAEKGGNPEPVWITPPEQGKVAVEVGPPEANTLSVGIKWARMMEPMTFGLPYWLEALRLGDGLGEIGFRPCPGQERIWRGLKATILAGK